MLNITAKLDHNMIMDKEVYFLNKAWDVVKVILKWIWMFDELKEWKHTEEIICITEFTLPDWTKQEWWTTTEELFETIEEAEAEMLKHKEQFETNKINSYKELYVKIINRITELEKDLVDAWINPKDLLKTNDVPPQETTK